ncbi:MAG: hypothetical protein HFE90_10490 [Firmicutes bacterium]|nr:hypothetical protein [Bacillota bacterium]
MNKRFCSAVLTVCMTASLMPMVSSAAQVSFNDLNGHWGQTAIERWAGCGVLNGNGSGKFNPNGNMTRAEFASMLVNIMGYTKKGENIFSDVPDNAWYADAILKLSAAGIMQGIGGNANPDAQISRAEAAVLLCRAFNIEPKSGSNLSFTDADDVADWAKGSIAALSEHGMINGVGGNRIAPLSNITRAAVAQLADNMIAEYITSDKVITGSVNGLIVVAGGVKVTVKDSVLSENLIIAPGANGAEVVMTGSSSAKNLLVQGSAVVKVDETASVSNIDMEAPNAVAEIAGSAENITISESASGASVTVTENAKVSSIEVSAEGTKVEVAGTVKDINIASGAEGTDIFAAESAEIENVNTNAENVKISGDGTVNSVTATGGSVDITTKDTNVVNNGAGDGNVIYNGNNVSENQQGGSTTTTPNTNSGGSGGSSGGSDSSITNYTTVLMNIPYGEFYKAELGDNASQVDAVSSATKNKPRTGTLAGGSYHVNSDGTDITGIIFPVRMTESDFNEFKAGGYREVTDSDSVEITVTNRGQTSTAKYEGKNALFESPSYSYYVITGDTPNYYKDAEYVNGELTFSAAQGTVNEISGANIELSVNGRHASYEIVIDDDGDSENKTGALDTAETVYGVVLSTSDNSNYGLRHVANIWRKTELGFDENDTKYASIMGKTINEIKYFTSSGIYTIPCEVYIPVKFADGSVEVANQANDAGAEGTSVVLTNFPEDYEPVYTVSKDETDITSYRFNVEDGKLIWNGNPPVGQYTLTVSDGGGRYAPYSAVFEIQTDNMPAAYDNATASLNIADGADSDDFNAYISAISSVTVDGTVYAASGRNPITIINKDGTVNFAAKSGSNDVFSGLSANKTYDIIVKATGYSSDLNFSLGMPDTVYGTASLTFREFYSGDVSSTDYYGADGVSSATVSKHSIMSNMYTDYMEDKTDGYNILGVKNVNVAVAKTDYDNYVAAEPTFAISNLQKAPAQYKKVTGVGNKEVAYKATEFNIIETVTDAEAVLATGSNWGDYEITVNENSTAYIRKDRTDENWKINSQIQGVILTGIDSDGADFKTGMEYLQSIWVQPYKIAFNVSADSEHNPHIIKKDNINEFARLVGGKITSITYIMPDGAYVYTFDDGIYIKPSYEGDNTVSAVFEEGSADVAISGVPELLEDVKVTVSYGSGRNAKIVADAVNITDGKITMTEEYDNTKTYTVKVSSSNYADIVVSLFMSSEQKSKLTELVSQAESLIERNEQAKADAGLNEHYNEAVALLANEKAASAEAAELISELTSRMQPYNTAQQVNLIKEIASAITTPVHEINNTDIIADEAEDIKYTEVSDNVEAAGNEDTDAADKQTDNISESDNRSQSAEESAENLNGDASDTVLGDESLIAEQDGAANDSESGGDEAADYADSQDEISED